MATETESGHRPAGRRYAILAEGHFRSRHAKTAHGLIRYGRDEVVAVIDSTLAGRTVLEIAPGLAAPDRDTPIVSGLDEAMESSPTSILVGLAPAGGRLPVEWMDTLRRAAAAGLEVVSGLHQRLAPGLAGANVWDVRQPPEDIPLFSGEGFGVAPKVALTVGTDTAVGKMTAALEIERAARARGIVPEFVATGQTGIIIAGWGISVDAVVSDFTAGAAEQLVLRAAESSPELILVEGQGSLGHPAYSGVTLSLLHGSCPDCLILCCDARPEEEIYAGVRKPAPEEIIPLYERVAALVKPAPVVAVSVNTCGLSVRDATAFVENVAEQTNLPATDPVRFSAASLLDAVLGAPKTSHRPRPVL